MRERKNSMKAKDDKGKGVTSTDFGVCFPSRAHLTLTSKPICSPSRPSESPKCHHRHHQHHHHILTRCGNKGGQASPLFWAKTKTNSSEITEPTSPKVTCAGKIKVRPKKKSSENLQSVMGESEKLHNRRYIGGETIGFKKDCVQLLTSLRGFRLDLGCFGSVKSSDATCIDEKEQETQANVEKSDVSGASGAAFSKWLVLMQQNNNNEVAKKEAKCKEEKVEKDGSCDGECASSAPPPNALLLMRCRSAPAKSLLGEKEQEEEVEQIKAGFVLEQEEKAESLILKYYVPDFLKVTSDITIYK
ncbi:hypothetical protein IFM89_022022 [Coptis chinensis]|uniref:Uncharacterized protein n=1 Tax=Coptis chinensis TaxID=261450 RepID=A0A835I576_9MAGN|nr:hypothetical protein IFM89_022022 [Coptis chinensis]